MGAASILKTHGFKQVVDVTNGFADFEGSRVPLTSYTCPSDITQEVMDAAVAAVV